MFRQIILKDCIIYKTQDVQSAIDYINDNSDNDMLIKFSSLTNTISIICDKQNLDKDYETFVEKHSIVNIKNIRISKYRIRKELTIEMFEYLKEKNFMLMKGKKQTSFTLLEKVKSFESPVLDELNVEFR